MSTLPTGTAVYIRNDSASPVTVVLDSGESHIVKAGAVHVFENGIAESTDEMDRLKGPDPNRKVTTYQEAFEEVLDLFPIAFRDMA